jgi:hypothetical protein
MSWWTIARAKLNSALDPRPLNRSGDLRDERMSREHPDRGSSKPPRRARDFRPHVPPPFLAAMATLKNGEFIFEPCDGR